MSKFKEVLPRRMFLFAALSSLIVLLAPRSPADATENPTAESYPPLLTNGEAHFDMDGCVELRQRFGGAC